jgi:hypothetical protein
MARFLRTAQMPPPTPNMGDMGMGTPPGPFDILGTPPMAPPMAPPVMPTAAPGAPENYRREEIGSPLDTLGKVLYDVDAPTLIMQMTGSKPDDIALHIWMLYGGDEKGGVYKNKVGERIMQTNVDPDVEKKEQKATENSRWRRLPKGKYINDITTLDELTSTIKGLVVNTVKNESQKGQSPGGAPPMLMASAARSLVRLANEWDEAGLHIKADWIDTAMSQFL